MHRAHKAAVPIVAFLLAAWLPDLLAGLGPYESLRAGSVEAALLLRATLQIGICVAALVAASRLPLSDVPGALGLRRSPLVGVAFGVVATLPMLRPVGARGGPRPHEPLVGALRRR